MAFAAGVGGGAVVMQSRKRLGLGGNGSRPFVIAYHLIWTAYGIWLPNDPRGSGSKMVCSDVIAHWVTCISEGRKFSRPVGKSANSAATLRGSSFIVCLTFDADARNEIAAAFGEVMESERCTCYACAIMPDHVHILIRKHKHLAEEMIEKLQDHSRLRLCTLGHRAASHPTWVGGSGWKIFLDHPAEICRTIPYIENNPVRLGLPIQRWPFVKPYDDWPLHPGHSPSSPYARRLLEAGLYDGSSRHA